MAAGIVRFGRQRHPITLVNGNPEFEGIDRIQSESVDKQRRICVNIGRRNVLELKNVNNHLFDFIIIRLHGTAVPS
jgi:hypothetical protein